MNARELGVLLKTKEGLLALVNGGERERDALELKRTYNRKDPRWREELRIDCAALATVGHGFLVVGVAQAEDGTDRALRITGVDDPTAMKTAISDALATGLSPAVTRRDVWVIETDCGSVVVAELRGRRGYPIEVEELKEAPRHFVREGGKKVPLSPSIALARRQVLDVALGKRRFLVGATVLLGMLSVGGAAAAVHQFDAPRRLDEGGRRAIRAGAERLVGNVAVMVDYHSDRETRDFAEDIVLALSVGELLRPRGVLDGFRRPRPGVSVGFPATENALGRGVVRALASGGVDASVFESSDVVVVVGPKR